MARLDPNAITEVRDLMGDDFPALIGTFQSDAPIQACAIEAAATRNDAEGVRRHAHGLKGASINLGAFDLAALCGRAEDAGRVGDCAAALDLLSTLRSELDAVCVVLQR